MLEKKSAFFFFCKTHLKVLHESDQKGLEVLETWRRSSKDEILIVGGGVRGFLPLNNGTTFHYIILLYIMQQL